MMQRTIYDFLLRKYELHHAGQDPSFRKTFTGSMKWYWGLKLIVVGIYIALFLHYVGKDQFLPSETYWFIGGIVFSLFVITLSYLNIFTAWFAIMLGKHRKWIDNLLIITGILLCIKLPVYTFGNGDVNFFNIQESLLLPGILMIAMGLYRKVHYRSSKVVPWCAAVSLLISAVILVKFPIDSIGQSIYLGFIMLVNAGFIIDLLVLYMLHFKSRMLAH
ncbi:MULTISPECIES: hypothetical protein [unclassified Paenibacillus]|uniref:hypothetical protein n=1 Tax=unclassified Paenibacillus TaxID=185978 RepID=UPI0030D71D13